MTEARTQAVPSPAAEHAWVRSLSLADTTWIVDLDGTVALFGDRGPYEYEKVEWDLPNVPVILIIQALYNAGAELIFVSGRMASSAGASTRWLRECVGPWASIMARHMRPDGDFRPDEVLKREIYDTLVDAGYTITGVFDDRAKVVRMWRDLGLLVFQVAEGNY